MATTVFDLQAVLGIDTSKFEAGLKRAKGIAGAMGSGLATAAKVGVAAIGAAAGAVTAFGVSSVKAGADFDKSMSQVAATMGKSMSEMANEVGTAMITVNGETKEFSGTLRDFALEMGKNTKFSATEAAEALNYMALAGYDTQTSMNMLPNVLNLAAAGDMELARASDMVTDTQTAFGLSLERTSQMVDEMAKAASTGNTSVEQLGDAFLTVGGLAKELNGGMVTLKDGTKAEVDGVQELEIALTAMANAGIKGSEAGTHMRNMLLKLSTPTDAGVKQLEELGVAVFDTEGNMRSLSDVFGDLSGAMDNLTQEQKLKAISDLFNTRDTASAEALLAAVGQDWNEIGESILNAQGAAQKMADTQLDNLAGDVTKFKSALEVAKITVSDVLSPALREFVQFGTEGLSRLTDSFKEGGLTGAMETFGDILGEGLNMIIEKMPEFINAGMELLSALGQGLMQNMPAILDAATQITTMLINALSQGLPQFIQGGIAILGAIGKAILDNLDTLIPAAIQIIQEVVLGIIQALPALAEGAIQLIVGLANGIAENLPIIIPAIVEVVLQIVQTLIDNIDLLINAAIQLMTGLAQGMIQALPIIIEKLPQIVQSIVEALINNLPLLLTAVIQINMALAQAIVENAPAFVEAVVQIFAMIVSTMASYGSQLMAQAKQIFSQVVQTAVQWLQQLPQRAGYFAGQMVGNFINALINLPNKIVELFSNILNTVINFGQKLIAEGPRMAMQFGDGLISKMKQIPEKMKAVGKAIVSALKDGVAGAWDSFTGWISDAISGFIEGLIASIVGGKGEDDNNGKNSKKGGGAAKLAVGTDYVPYDNFPALLHKGEMVVPAKISEDLRNFIGGNIKSVQPTNNLTSQPVQVTVVLEGDADRLFRVVQSKATSNYRVTGQRDLVTI